jgi:hypothetical protein
MNVRRPRRVPDVASIRDCLGEGAQSNVKATTMLANAVANGTDGCLFGYRRRLLPPPFDNPGGFRGPLGIDMISAVARAMSTTVLPPSWTMMSGSSFARCS